MAAVRKLKPVEETLEDLIDTAGGITERISILAKEREAIRARIKEQMPLVDESGNQLDSLEVTANDYRATYGYGTTRSVNPHKLFDLDGETFWQLVKIDLGTAEKIIDKVTFNALLDWTQDSTPTLTVNKIKKQ